MISKRLFNDGWEFSCQKPGTDIDSLGKMEFERVNLPHDWQIYHTDDLYMDSTGFYRKRFVLRKKAGRRYEIYFEGVYMDTSVYLNGVRIGEWKYGYSSFFFDITDELKDGENELAVKIEYLSPNSRWYSGAGIFRDVYFIEHYSTHIVTDSLYVSAKPFVPEGEKITAETDLSGKWEVKVSAEIVNGVADYSWNGGYAGERISPIGARTKLTLWFPMLGKSHSALIGAVKAQETDGVARVEFKEVFEGLQLWSLEDPKLYDCAITVFDPEADYSDRDPSETENLSDNDLSDNKKEETGDNKIRLKPGEPAGDSDRTLFGFRSFVFDTEKGLFINGKHTKLNGVCEHHDLGGIGAVFNRTAMKRKLKILADMGVNAVRCAHNMPAVGLLELCDSMGFLVMDEAFDMWESSKTEFDYGRFFKEWQERDVRSWVRRDRNHPCVVMWSIGNEIYDTHKDDHGQEITRYLKEETRENDFYENAVITIGSNYMPWEGAQKCADILKYAGYNYAEKFYDEHHEKHKDWYIFGSETSSTVQSRGIYHFPYLQSTLADDDMQCSCLGNSTTSWGAPNPEYCIIAERDHEFSLGQFLWSGFDYIGEPTPYHTRNSYFGQIDTAGFPKDTYYLYKSAWTDYRNKPFAHLFPYWDFNGGQEVDVRIATNAPQAELFVNGRSLGKKNIDHAKGKVLTADYTLPYEKGEIVAVCYDENGKEIARDVRHSFGDSAKLELKLYDSGRKFTAGNGDMAFIEVRAVDKDGYPVENASDPVTVKVEGAGYLTALDNGDSTDTDEYKGCCKRLFSGKMLIMVAIGEDTGNIRVAVSAPGTEGAELTFAVSDRKETEGISLIPEVLSDKPAKSGRAADGAEKAETGDIPRVRKIVLTCEGGRMLTKEMPLIKVHADILPEKASMWKDELLWKAVDRAGIDSNIARIIESDGDTITVKAIGDGAFKIRCMVKCGCEAVKVISELDFCASGIGEARLDPYGFIAGGLCCYHEGDIGNGNDHGISTQRNDKTVFGFEDIDFGDYGSDEITVPLFVLSGGKYPMQIWEGIPGREGSSLLADVVYEKPAMWNTYQSETYKLSKRLKGVTGLYFVTYDKAQFAGFSFKRLCKAYELLRAGECDSVYGDSFEKKEDRIDNIGNNVTVEFSGMDFGENGACRLEISGKSHIPVNTIHVIFDDGNDSKRSILEFTADGGDTQSFEIEGFKGKGDVRFVFLPGSSFDFASLRFVTCSEDM